MTKPSNEQIIQRIHERCKEDILFFTRYFFVQRFGRKFVVGEHHIKICEALMKVINGDITRLIINIAPRYGKTELVVKNFMAYGLAINPAAKFIHLSYADDLALDNSEEAKSIVQSDAYQALFPDVKIKPRSDSKKKWYTQKAGGVYATSTGGQVTGFGAGTVDDIDAEAGGTGGLFSGALILDDPIKPEDADSEIVRTRVNTRWDSTISNRVNSRDTPIIIIMQRLHELDLCGYLTEKEGEKWTVISLPSIKEDGTALWSFKHTIEDLRALEERNPVVFERQHMQKPVPIQGRLYKTFKTYETIPVEAQHKKKAVIDTADKGTDYLCSIVYNTCDYGYYVTDVYYTQKGMEVTEQETAIQLSKHNVDECRVESNNGGSGFARNVERICRVLGNYMTRFEWFHQSENKEVRIFTKAAEVQNMIYYPVDWETRWPEFARAVKNYMAMGKNAHDDAPDCLTSIIESETQQSRGYVGR